MAWQETNKRSPVSIVGYSLRAPNCSSVPEFAKALRDSEDLTTSSTRYPGGHLGLPPRQGRIKDEDIASFDPSFFHLSHKQAEAMDPTIRMLLQVSYEALMDACISIESVRGSKTGVYVGHCFADVMHLSTSSFNPKKTGYELVNGVHAMAANRLSFFYDFKGPSLTIDTACSSSFVALHYAMRDLENGTIERAVVAGLSLTLSPHVSSSFNAFTMLSPTGHCYAFDERADGYCRSDGVACIILERGLRGYAMVAGTGTNSDGAKSEGITYPSATQQARLINEVFSRSWVDPQDVSYHEAHGTGTIAGDREELSGLSQVYSHSLVIGSVKSNMGHAEGASGLMGLIKILLMYEDQELYPNFDFQTSPHALVKDGRFVVLKKVKKWKPTPCTISNFGFGGTNAFAILAPCTSLKALPRFSGGPARCLPFGASEDVKVPLRSHDSYYAVQRLLGNCLAFKFALKDGHWKEYSPLVFVCDGQGSQWNTMGKDLLKTSSVFLSTMERLGAETGIPLVNLYEDGSQWMLKEKSPIGIVSFQLGMLAVLREAGIYPDIFLGHSIGELVCSFLAGLATEADVLRFALVRTRLVSLLDPDIRLDVYKFPPSNGYDYVIKPTTSGSHQDDMSTDSIVVLDEIDCSQSSGSESVFSCCKKADASGWLYIKRVENDAPLNPSVVESFSMDGQMALVGCSADVITNAIEQLGLQQTRVACYNAPEGQTISGPSIEVEQLVKHLKKTKQDLYIRQLPTDGISYHATYLKIFRDWLRDEFRQLDGSKPLPAPWRSTSRNNVFSREYLVDNICRPVYFQEAIETLPNGSTVIEIGPGSGMLSLIKRTRPDLVRIGLIERNSPTKLDRLLQQLRPWVTPQNYTQGLLDQLESGSLEYDERYPLLWSKRANLHVPSWQEFEMKREEPALIKYDLTKKPWQTLRDHVIQGQNLFPAAGFVHAIWSAVCFEQNVEIIDLRIHTPLVIASSAEAVELCLCKAGTTCELWDDSQEIRYASAQVQPIAATACPPAEPKIHEELAYISGSSFYPDCRRLGYEYGDSYQLLEKVSPKSAYFRYSPSDWISYVDNTIHLRLVGETSFAYPVGFDRIVFWKKILSEAPLWVTRLQENSVGNSAVLLEGIRMEYVPRATKAPSIHREIFVQYGEQEVSISPNVIAAVLCRESRQFRVDYPLVSPLLSAIANKLQSYELMKCDSRSSSVVISDSSQAKEAELLVTVDSVPPATPHVLVARWGEVWVYRLGILGRTLPVIGNWKDAAKMTGPFVWKGTGASGACASLAEETQNRIKAISYEGPGDVLVGLEKGMRHNFVREDGTHGIWVAVDDDLDKPRQLKSCSVALEITRPGQLNSLGWRAISSKNLGVKITVATLNFRDVMRAMGRLKEKDLSLGLEFSGIDLVDKKRVFGVAKNSLSTQCSPIYSFPTPPELSDREAATLPVVYLTVYYALFHKAQMKRGQSILIHAGTGGVGMAAITVAQKRGLQIFTTCSASKRQYLKDKFGLVDAQIGDSRSDAFLGTVMTGTNGRGVDVVLNQLSGALQVASLRCLAPGGNFCEIGKYDILQNTRLGQGLLAANVSFHVIDLLPLIGDEQYKTLWDKFLKDGFAKKEIIPLPTIEFDASKLVDAFRFMSQGKHTGKIVITGLQGKEFAVRNVPLTVSGETHLITGGLGGLGLSLAARLADAGCQDVVLVGRRGVTNGFQRNKIAKIKALGCKVHIVEADLTTLTPESVPAPDKIWHVATVYRDQYLSEMTSEAWDLVFGTKLEGYRNLRRCWPSTHITAISSITAYFGNSMQTSYSLANAALDDAARHDSRMTSIRLGPLDNVGFITKSETHRKLFEYFPFETMRVDDVLDKILQITSEKSFGVFGIYDLKLRNDQFTWNKKVHGISEHLEKKRRPSLHTMEETKKAVSAILGGSPGQYKANTVLKAAGLDSLSSMEIVNYVHTQSGSQSFKASNITDGFTMQDLLDTINSGRSAATSFFQPTKVSSHAIISFDDARKTVAAILGGNPNQYKPHTSLKAVGLDSLSTMEIVQYIQSKTDSQAFKPSHINENFTIQDIVETINRQNSIDNQSNQPAYGQVQSDVFSRGSLSESSSSLSEGRDFESTTQPLTASSVHSSTSSASSSSQYYEKVPETKQANTGEFMTSPSSHSQYGIVAIEVYTPQNAITADELQQHGIPAAERGQEAVAVWDAQEDSISMAMNAVAMLLEKHVDDPYVIGRLEVGTQSNIDMAKSIKSYLMDLFPEDHYDVEGVDNTNACYGGTSALLNSIAWCRETERYAIVVATDTADMDVPESYWRGASAVAMLVGPNPWIEIHPERISCFKNTQDFLKPRYSQKLSPYIKTRDSMDNYLHALDYTIDKLRSKHAINPAEFDAIVFHGGLCATFMKLVEQHLVKTLKPTQLCKANFEHARKAASYMGGLYTASTYINLVSLLSNADQRCLHRIGIFSYGSGSAATLLHATVHHERGHPVDLLRKLENRILVSHEILCQIAKKDEQNAVLDRKAGIFYRDLSQESVERSYFRESVEQLLKETSSNDPPAPFVNNFRSRSDEMSGLFVLSDTHGNASAPANESNQLSFEALPKELEHLKDSVHGHQLIGLLIEMFGEYTNVKDQQEINLPQIETKLTPIIKRLEHITNILFSELSPLKPHQIDKLGEWLTIVIRPYCMLGQLVARVITKPRGYAGDFLTIDSIYNENTNSSSCNNPFGVAINQAFLKLGAAKAVQNRRGMLTEQILKSARTNGNRTTEITALACGPSREVHDFLTGTDLTGIGSIKFHLLDIDNEALAFVEKWRNELPRDKASQITLYQRNLLHLCSGEEQLDIVPQDLVYSMGLIDYFVDAVVVQILNYIYDRLKPGGRVILGNFHKSNPTRAIMDTVLDWKLIYRDENDLNRIFRQSKFDCDCSEILRDNQGIQLLACCER